MHSHPPARFAARAAVRLALCAAVLATTADRSLAADTVNGNLIHFNNNGGWSWFEDERAIIDPISNKLLVGSVATVAGLPTANGGSRTGDIDVASFDLGTRTTARVSVLHAGLEADDHNSPALLLRPDGRYLTSYSRHSKDALTYYRVSLNPGDATSWQPEQAYSSATVPGATIVTYSNLYRLSAEGKTYDFHRSRSSDPQFLASTNDGSTFTYGGWLTTDPAVLTAQRPYVKYASNDTDTIYFLSTDGHPREFKNSATGLTNNIYAGYLKGGQLYQSDGTLVGAPSGVAGPNGTRLGPSIDKFTKIFSAQPEGVIGNRTAAWTVDLAMDAQSRPYAVFSSRVETDTNTATQDTGDHRFYYGRFDGTQWRVNELAKAGGFLFGNETDYTGLVALDPNDPDTLYMSSNIHPVTQTAMPHYEIFKGVTGDFGSSWAWSAVTENSTVDNIRPIMPKWNGTDKALLWMRGSYPNFTQYDMAVVGLIEKGGAAAVTGMQYVDASALNTTLVSGTPAVITTGTGPGATDGLWHVRLGVGNNGTVYTADESSSEDTSSLRTTVNGVDAGTYDVWAYFWSDKDEAWQVQAGLSGSSLAFVEKQGAAHVELVNLKGGTVVESGDLLLYRVYLGRTDVGAAGTLSAFIDDGRGTSALSRTWYDGIGYARVTVPEPATLAAFALPLSMFRRRRR